MLSKRILMLLVSILCIIMVGCKSLNNKEENSIIISKGEINNALGMGVNYKISNLMKDEYSVEIYAKEYKLGELKEEYNLFEDKIKIEDKEILSAGVYDENDNLFSGINGGFISKRLEFFNKSNDIGMAMSILDNEKELKLNKEIPICAYSIGNKDKGTMSINLSDDLYLGENESDLIIYLKINKVN